MEENNNNTYVIDRAVNLFNIKNIFINIAPILYF